MVPPGAAEGPPKALARWPERSGTSSRLLSWVGADCLPDEVQALLRTHPLAKSPSFADAKGIPELRVRIDGYAGEPRNTDLAIVYRSGDSLKHLAAVSIEAKADEPFGQTIGAAIAASMHRRENGRSSNGDLRAKELAHAVLGCDVDDGSDVGKLRYQLLTATAGALAYAQENDAQVAVLAILEFVDPQNQHTKSGKVLANARHLDAFVDHLSGGTVQHIANGILAGPFFVMGNAYIPRTIPLLVGKACRVLV